MKKLIILAMLLQVAAGVSTQAQVSQWIAFNDHYSGPNTGTNVTAWNIMGTTGGAPGSNGFLTNIITGAQLPVTMTVSNITNGITGGTTSSGPFAGTPAATMFTNYIDWGNGTLNHAIQLAGSSKIVHAFSGLDPSRRYSWHGSAVRGNNYNLRWTLVEIGAASWTDAHTLMATGVFTTAQIPSLTSSQAVFNSGENRAPGVLVGWTNIAPNPDGTLLIYQTTYRGPMPTGFAVDTGNYGYAMMADRLEEFSVGPTIPVGITNQPQSITLPERGAATFSLMATGSPQSIQWYRSDNAGASYTPIPGAGGSSYTISSVAYPGDNGARFRATVTNTANAVTSSVATLTVVQDRTPPTVIRVVGDTDLTKVHLTFSEPIDPSTVSESSFEVFVTGTAPDGSYITFGASLTNGTNVDITSDARLPGTSYSVQILDVRDASSGNNVVNPNPTQVPIITTVQLIGFDTDNEWKYDINNGDRTGTGWEQPGFDDSTWPSGPAGLGLDASVNGVPIRTTLPYSATTGWPTYFRKHFNFPGKTNGVVMMLRDVVEDGAVYYLNGQEVLRNRMPAGAITFTTLATGATDPTPIAGPFSLAITNLQPGDNVLAVAVYQSSTTSSDVELAVELTATIQEYLTGAPKITAQPQSQTVTEGGTASFSASVEGAIPLSYTWKKGGVAIPGATNASYAISGVVPSNAGSYGLSVTNAFGGTNSTVVTLTVAADTTPPFIVSAVGSTNSNVVIVTLRDPQPGRGLNLTSAQTTNNYQIALKAGGGALTVLSAVATNVTSNTVVTLTTSASRTAGQDYTLTLNSVVDNAVAANLITPNTAPIAATVLLFPFTQNWRYDQSGTDLGTAWKDAGYNDSAWLSGAGILGFETTSNTLYFFTNTILALPNGTNTVLSLTNNTLAGIGGTNVTFYFRTTVNVPFSPAGATFTARAYIDDGAIFYINGVEQLRYNQTNGSGYTNFANAGLTEPTPVASTTFIVSNLTGFVQGNNVIAVEVHQDAVTSSDIDFGMQLEALVTSFTALPPGPTMRVGRNAGQVTISWAGTNILQQATNLLGGGATQWIDVPGNPAGTYNFAPNGQRLFFRVR